MGWYASTGRTCSAGVSERRGALTGRGGWHDEAPSWGRFHASWPGTSHGTWCSWRRRIPRGTFISPFCVAVRTRHYSLPCLFSCPFSPCYFYAVFLKMFCPIHAGYWADRQTRPPLAQNYPCTRREYGSDHRARDLFYWCGKWLVFRDTSTSFLFRCPLFIFERNKQCDCTEWCYCFSVYRPWTLLWRSLKQRGSLIKKCCSDSEILEGWVIALISLLEYLILLIPKTRSRDVCRYEKFIF